MQTLIAEINGHMTIDVKVEATLAALKCNAVLADAEGQKIVQRLETFLQGVDGRQLTQTLWDQLIQAITSAIQHRFVGIQQIMDKWREIQERYSLDHDARTKHFGSADRPELKWLFFIRSVVQAVRTATANSLEHARTYLQPHAEAQVSKTVKPNNSNIKTEFQQSLWAASWALSKVLKETLIKDRKNHEVNSDAGTTKQAQYLKGLTQESSAFSREELKAFAQDQTDRNKTKSDGTGGFLLASPSTWPFIDKLGALFKMHLPLHKINDSSPDDCITAITKDSSLKTMWMNLTEMKENESEEELKSREEILLAIVKKFVHSRIGRRLHTLKQSERNMKNRDKKKKPQIDTESRPLRTALAVGTQSKTPQIKEKGVK